MKLSDIAEYLDGELVGDSNIEINGVCKIDHGIKNKITFLSGPKYKPFLKKCKASAVLIDLNIMSESEIPYIKVSNPLHAYTKVLSLFYKQRVPFDGIHASAVIENSAKIGKNAAISANVYIGKNVILGEKAIIYPNTVIMNNCTIGNNFRSYSSVSIDEHSKIGNNVTLHAGVTLGADGFGYVADPPHGLKKILQIGRVVLEDDVEIGANTTVDRAAIGDTIIGKGTKLDNLIQIGHGVEMGQYNVLSASCAVAGSTKIGHWNQIGGNVSIVDHIIIGNQNQIAANTFITKNIADKQLLMGQPHRSSSDFKRIYAAESKLPQLIKDFRTLKKELNEMKKQLSKKSYEN